MITLLTALKETNVVLGELATECEDLHHLFLGDRLRQQLKLNRAVIARIENAATIIQSRQQPDRSRRGEGTKTGRRSQETHDAHDGEGPQRTSA